MRRRLILAALLCSMAPGQWLKYPTPNVPRTKDGKPNLNAPSPRTKDGHPDFSGMWDVEHNRPCPPGGCDDMFIPREFLNIGWSLPDGLPYTSWAADQVKQRKAASGSDDPTSRCLPGGVVKTWTHPLFKKLLQTPGQITVLTERDASYRQIFTDGRSLPVDPQPSYNGYSSGKWEGDALVVQTNGFRDGTWLDRDGSPLTAGAKMTERIRRPNFGTLEVEITVDDPKAYTKPWTVKLKQLILLDTEMLDYICNENEKDQPHITGK